MESRDRVLTIPNVLSVIRLVLVPVFLYLLLCTHAYGWAVAILMFSGFSDWADGKIARLVANQSSRLGELLDPLVDRIYMLAVPIGLGFAGIVPWWVVGDADRARRRAGRHAAGGAQPRTDRPAGHLHRQGRHLRADVRLPAGPAGPVATRRGAGSIGACGWGFVIWGMGMYLWSAVLYLLQVRLVVRTMPKVTAADRRTDSSDAGAV